MDEDIQSALDWLRNWYKERSLLRKPNGDIYLTEAELALINDRLKDAHVVLSEYPYLDFYKGVKEGKYHLLGNNTMESHMTEYELKERSVGYVGVHFRNIVEPVLFINPNELLSANLYWEDNSGRQVWGTLGKIVVHEATHLATKGTRHEFVLEEYMGSRVRMYSEKEVDKPYEVYARINELRYDLGVKPDHVFTLEEIKTIRKELKKNLREYKAEVKAKGRNNFKSLDDFSFAGRPTDPRLFELYSDEEILDFLNNTACRDVRIMQMEHFLEDARPIEPSFALASVDSHHLTSDNGVYRASGRTV